MPNRNVIPWWKKSVTTESFNVANRNVSCRFGTVSIAATWTQAIALLGSGIYAIQSVWHLLIFSVLGGFALVIMALVAPRFSEAMPKNEKFYTVAQWLGYSLKDSGIRTLAFVSSVLTLAIVVGFTLTALLPWISQQLAFPPLVIAFGLCMLAFICVVPRGLVGAVRFLDVMKFTLISCGMIGILVLDVTLWGSHAAIMPRALTVDPLLVLWFVGVPLAASLLPGGICNVDTATRAYAVCNSSVRMAYLGGALFFSAVILDYGSTGFLAQSMGIMLAPKQAPLLIILLKQTPHTVVIGVTIALAALLVAAIGSLLDASSTLFSVEVYKRCVNPSATDKQMVRWGRIGMLGAIALGIWIAYFNFDLTRLLESLAIVRGPMLIPVLVARYKPDLVRGRTVFWAMLIGSLGGALLMFGGPFLEFLSVNSVPGFFSVQKGALGVSPSYPVGALVAVFGLLPSIVVALVRRIRSA